MRNFRVRIQIDVFAVEYDPFPIRRRYRCADALQRHHVFEREWALGCWLSDRTHGETENCDYDKHHSHAVLDSEQSQTRCKRKSGEHTSLACWFRRPAETTFES